jgi:putative membrane protein
MIRTAGAAERPRGGAMARWSSGRIAVGLMLAAWAGLFWFLLVSERWSLYLSTRTSWLVPVGAVLLSVAAVGRLASARSSDEPEPLSTRRTWTIGLMMFPVVVILALPPAALTSYAVGRRSGFVGAGISTSTGDIATGSLTLIDVAAAQTTSTGLDALEQRAGEVVTFDGFVMRYADTPAEEIMLTRYIVTCCVADATIAQVRVVNVPAGTFQQDQWVRVTGRIYPLGREVIVDASDVVGIPRPGKPYLTP